MRVILAEKPSVARDVARAIGAARSGEFFATPTGSVMVVYALGHLLEVDEGLAPTPWRLEDLPILPETFRYRSLPKGASLLKALEGVLKKAKEVVVATDPGREGELIARLILRHLGWKGKTLRLWTAEALTPEVVRRELAGGLRPWEEFEALYQAALARQHADWLVGVNLTRALTLRAPGQGVWSVGRVQTPTLRLVVDREEAIEAFQPTPYGVVEGEFSARGFRYRGRLQAGPEGLTPEEARALAEALQGETKGKVLSVDREEALIPPPLLHSLTSLQREANARFGLTAKRTLDLAQALYEKHKCISYPRTDARHLPRSARPLVEKVLKALGREDLLPRVGEVGKRVFDDSKLTDHHAIIPLTPPPEGLSPDERKVYDLVRSRFLAAFSPPAKEEKALVRTGVGKEVFLSRFRHLLEAGWTVEEPLHREEEGEEEGTLFPLAPGEEVEVLGVRWEKRETKPPSRFTEGTLLREMERLGLGTPATRAGILETLKERGYLFSKGKSLRPTEKGRALIALLREREVASPEMTARWERSLEQIWQDRLGEEGYRRFMEGIRSFVRREVEAILALEVPEVRKEATPKMLAYARSLAQRTGRKLPGTDFESVKAFIDETKGVLQEGLGQCKCGGKVSAFSKGWKCEGGHVVWAEILGKRLTAKQALTLLQGESLRLEGLKGKSGKPFAARLYFDWGEGKVRLAFD
ncbi:type IA DNA topoisomerase [Thermus sp.]|uniref:type IA DNA topoisomerase n=1 Tax=Thermus sp. TaxID=275 RepID=UPI002632F857|nr:type IA DNA topoisomerase [Thermus sp.]MCX7849667.1 DNA topoisomerase [Thermus sp.]